MTISTIEEESGPKEPFSYLVLSHPPYQAPDSTTVVPYWCVIDSFTLSCKIPEFFEKSHLSGAGKHPDFQVTSCLHFDTTYANFAYIASE